MQLVVAHCPRGAVAAVRGGGVVRQPALRVPADEIVAANGAGDAFAAGTMYGVHQRFAVEDCLALGRAAAAASLRALSTTAAVVTVAECLALARRWGEREPI
jgi:sugar/nucleoside kinase (ribokinase family)